MWCRKSSSRYFAILGTFVGRARLKTWIYRITVNEAHNARRWFFRHRRREVELDTDPEETRNWKEIIPDRSRSPFDVAFDREQHVMIEAALEKINPIFREAVVLRDITDHELRRNRGNPGCFPWDCEVPNTAGPRSPAGRTREQPEIQAGFAIGAEDGRVKL